MILPLSLLLVLAGLSQEQNPGDPSPCPNVFMYGPKKAQPGRWYGVVNLSTDNTLHSLWLNIVLDNEAWVVGNSIGNTTTQDNKNFQIENAAMKITPGPAVVVYFFVQYNPDSVVPRLLAIRLNGKEICNFIIKTPVRNPSDPPPPPRRVVNTGNDRIGDVTTEIQNQKPTTPQSPRGQCGKVEIYATGNLKGQEQWPWQIALYQTKKVENKYICGGTLVSDRHIITAAHCVTRKSPTRVVDRYTLTVYLGKHNLRTSVDGVQISSVKEITVHQEYDATTFSHDVAILELSQPLKYTDSVRPACLWRHDADLNQIVGKEGTLIGWVFDDSNQVLNELMPEKVPVVSQEACRKSHSNFFTRFTSEFTYCAGKRKMSPCPSAGSGMVFKSDNAWYIRGFVSLSVPKENAFQCDSTHYTIFTDLAKFWPWINNIVSSD